MIGVKDGGNGAQYEADDVIQSFPDDYVFAGNDLANGRTVIALGAITDRDTELLQMEDEARINHSAISQLPAFRSISSGVRGLSQLRRRKYQWTNGSVTLKGNAQAAT